MKNNTENFSIHLLHNPNKIVIYYNSTMVAVISDKESITYDFIPTKVLYLAMRQWRMIGHYQNNTVTTEFNF